MSSETFLRQTCPRPKDLKQLFEAIRRRWPTLKYPLGKRKESGAHSDETGRLHNMFDIILETLSGGKCDEFLLDYLDGRYRRELKTNVTRGLAGTVLAPLIKLLKACPGKKACSEQDIDTNIVTAIRVNVVKALHSSLSKNDLKEECKIGGSTYSVAASHLEKHGMKLYIP